MTTLVFVALAQGDQQAGYTASFPDLPDIAASGADMAELVTTAREAVLQELQRIADDGREWPKPTPIEDVTHKRGVIAFLVDITVEDTPVRVNISIGERLLKRIDQGAEARGMSRSGFIASAARTALGDRPASPGVTDFDAVARKLQDEWSVLGRKITDSLGPDSAFNRNMTEFDNKVTETIRKTADNISAAMARRKETEARAAREEAAPTAES